MNAFRLKDLTVQPRNQQNNAACLTISFNSHLILLLNTISIKFIIAVKIDVKPHTILKFRFKDQLFYRISVEKWDKLVSYCQQTKWWMTRLMTINNYVSKKRQERQALAVLIFLQMPDTGSWLIDQHK